MRFRSWIRGFANQFRSGTNQARPNFPPWVTGATATATALTGSLFYFHHPEQPLSSTQSSSLHTSSESTNHPPVNGAGDTCVIRDFPPMTRPEAGTQKGLVIFTGGTGFNNTAKVLQEEQMRQYESDTAHMRSLAVSKANDPNETSTSSPQSITSPALPKVSRVTYVLPVSDDGGSSAEIIRVLGGSAIGDVRSRLLRLAIEDTEEAKAVKRVLEYRLPSDEISASESEGMKDGERKPVGGRSSPRPDTKAFLEWREIVDGSHPIWTGISPAYKSTIRRFLVAFDTDISVADGTSSSSRPFDFRNGSVGNFFFTGSRRFFNSIEAAIFWFSRVAGIPRTSSVVPSILPSEHVGIAARLEDGSVIVGQSNISHPIPSHALGTILNSDGQGSTLIGSQLHSDTKHTTNSSNSILTKANSVDKEHFTCLPAPIDKIYFSDNTGRPLSLPANPRLIRHLSKATAIVYGMGSLYTSILPSLIPENIGQVVAGNTEAEKVLIMNSTPDRETGNMTPTQYVRAVVRALDRYQDDDENLLTKNNRADSTCIRNPLRYVTTLVVPEDMEIDKGQLTLVTNWGIKVQRIPIKSMDRSHSSTTCSVRPYDDHALARYLLSL